MTLTETLQLKHKYLQCEDLRALEHCEQRWLEEGCPAERWALVNFIEKMLKELKASGIGYPKILLLRKKEIQRREFVPGVTAETETKNSNTSGLIPADWIAQANRESRENWEKMSLQSPRKRRRSAGSLRDNQRPWCRTKHEMTIFQREMRGDPGSSDAESQHRVNVIRRKPWGATGRKEQPCCAGQKSESDSTW